MNFLKRLFNCGKSEAADVPPEFLEENPPDWVVVCTGKKLPHGNAFSIRLKMLESSRSANAEIVVIPHGPDAKPEMRNVTPGQPIVDQLLVILGFSFPEDISDVPGEQDQGLPLEFSIYRREPVESATAKCNLDSWLGTKQHGPPVVELGRLLIGWKDGIVTRQS